MSVASAQSVVEYDDEQMPDTVDSLGVDTFEVAPKRCLGTWLCADISTICSNTICSRRRKWALWCTTSMPTRQYMHTANASCCAQPQP